MGILDIQGFSKGENSQYKEIHKILSTYYQNDLPTNRDDYNKSRNAKETAERELFSIVGKDEDTVNLLGKYNCTVSYLEEIYERIIEEGGGQIVRGKFIPVLAMTDIKTLTYLIENLRHKDLSKKENDMEIVTVVANLVRHYRYEEEVY